MKKSLRKIFFLISFVSFAIFAFLQLDLAFAGSLADKFYMTDGASVSFSTDYSGIRFETTIDETWFNGIYSEGDTIEYGTIFNSGNQIAEIEDLTLESKGNVKVIKEQGVEFTDGKYTYYAGLSYDKILDNYKSKYPDALLSDAEILNLSYNLRIVARSYIKITDIENQTHVYYAEATDTVRTAREVANAAILYGDIEKLKNEGFYTPEEIAQMQAKIESYLGDRLDIGKAVAYDMTLKGPQTVYIEDMPAEPFTVLIDAKRIEYSASGNELTILNVPTSLCIGDHYLSLICENGDVTSMPIALADKVIKTSKDLDVFKVDVTKQKNVGYYVLGNDIVDYGYTMTHESADGGFGGVFNGLGHSISCNVSSYGMFGILYEGAEIKNVAFKDMVSTAQYNASVLGFQASGTEKNSVKIHDVYISVKSVYASDFNRFGTILVHGTNQLIMQLKNVVIELEFEGTLPTNGCGALYYTDLGRNGQYQANNIYQNVFIVTKNEMPLVYNPNYTVYAENEQDKVVKQNDCFFYGVKRFNNYDALKSVVTVDEKAAFDDHFWETEYFGYPVPVVVGNEMKRITLNGKEISGYDIALDPQDQENNKAVIDVLLNDQIVKSTLSAVGEHESISIDHNTITAINTTSVPIVVKLSYRIGGILYVNYFNVFVAGSESFYPEVIDYFSAEDGGNLPLKEVFGEGVTAHDLTAMQGETVLTLSDDEIGNILVFGVNVNKNDLETTISVSSDNKTVLFNVKAYTKVLEKSSDLNIFRAGDDWTENLDGYYIVKNDITSYDNSGFNATANQSTTTYGFSGIFDGNGKTITLKSLMNGGIFHNLSSGAVIKNVAINVEKISAIFSACVLADNIYADTAEQAVVVDNVYVKVGAFAGASGNNTGGLFWRVSSIYWQRYVSLKNVLVDYPGVEGTPVTCGGTIAGIDYMGGMTMENVYIVCHSKTPVAYDVKNNNVRYAFNDAVENADNNVFVYQNCFRYDSYQMLYDNIKESGAKIGDIVITNTGASFS